MTIDLYYVLGSPPCHAVIMTAKLLGVEFNLKTVQLMKGEHLTQDFLKMNPQHTIPTIDDNGFYLYESRAIMTYLFNKYGKKDSLYPKDAQKRAIVDQRLFFDMGTLYQRFVDYAVSYPVLLHGATSFIPEKLEKVKEALGWLDGLLEGSEFAAGNILTLADAALISTISTIDAAGIVDLSKYENVTTWYERCQAAIADYEETTCKGTAIFKQFFESKKQTISHLPP